MYTSADLFNIVRGVGWGKGLLFDSYNDRPPRWAPLVSGFGMAGKKLLTQPDFPL